MAAILARHAPEGPSQAGVATAYAIPAVQPPPLRDLLSCREEEIARLAARGLSNKEIAQRLGISPWMVATHLRRMFLKLDISRRIEPCPVVSALGRTG